MALFCSAGIWKVFLKMTLYVLYVNKHMEGGLEWQVLKIEEWVVE